MREGFIPLIKFNCPRLIWINNNKIVFDKILVLGIPRHEGKIVREMFSKDSVMNQSTESTVRRWHITCMVLIVLENPQPVSHTCTNT